MLKPNHLNNYRAVKAQNVSTKNEPLGSWFEIASALIALCTLLANARAAEPSTSTEVDGKAISAAVLASTPLAYWPIQERDGETTPDIATGKHAAEFEPDAGPDSPESKQPNFYGGRLRVRLEKLPDTYTVTAWFWNDLPHDARPITAYLFSRGELQGQNTPGDHLGIGGTFAAPGRLIVYNGEEHKTLLEGTTQLVPRTWNHVAFIRDGKKIAVFLNGNPQPEISGEAERTYAAGEPQFVFGGRSDKLFGLHGRLTHAAIFDRKLPPDEIAAHFKAGEVPVPDPTKVPMTTGETEHFWYRLAPAHPYVDSQRESKAFGFGKGKIFLSEDNGQTWPHSAEFPDADNVTFSCILKNGNIVFATRTKLYLSTDNLQTYKQITVKDQKGRDYLPHTPQDPQQPGWYFHPLDGVHTWDVDGREMLVWGNYCNVLGGQVPINIYYSTDDGQTVKIAYAFGHNPDYLGRDAKTGAPLGDADNPVVCRHIHSVTYNPVEKAFYACTGDHDREKQYECHWLRGVYDAKDDSWQWKVIVSDRLNSRYKSGGINFVDGQLYWASDANGPLPHDRGIFRCAPADIADPKKHTMLFNPEYESANMIIEDGVILSAHYAPASPYHTGIIISPDLGKTWAQYDLKQFGRRSPVRFQKKNSEGWFRVDLRTGWIGRGEVLLIKPK